MGRQLTLKVHVIHREHRFIYKKGESNINVAALSLETAINVKLGYEKSFKFHKKFAQFIRARDEYS
jgi:hypothetical protein